MTPRSLVKSSNNYDVFVESLRREITKGLQKAQDLLEKQKAITYWSVGKQINQYLSLHADEHGGKTAFYEKTAEHLGINARTLQQCEQFFRYFPNVKIKSGLSWSHFRYLLSVPDNKTRQAWLKISYDEHLTTLELRRRLLASGIKEDAQTLKSLNEPKRGALYVYRLKRADNWDGIDAGFCVDCGFSVRVEASQSSGTLDNKWLYGSLKENDGYRLVVTKFTTDALFTFKAKIIRIIDADTLLTAVDLGFGIWSEQKLRFSGLDAPEVSTVEGQKAKQWLKEKLEGLPFVVIKTTKSDKYDRYLVDVFYSSAKNDDALDVAQNGVWLNGEMVALGLAKVWGE
jgi:micrococcal nuclease